MKFEMKKRILALALAGTTAFSVFGAAVSANAAGTSTHTWYSNDQYVSYNTAASKINVKKTASTTGVANQYTDTVTNVSNASLNVIKEQAQVTDNYVRGLWVKNSTIFTVNADNVPAVKANNAQEVADYIKKLSDANMATALNELGITDETVNSGALAGYVYNKTPYTSLAGAIEAYMKDTTKQWSNTNKATGVYTFNYFATTTSLKADSAKKEILPEDYDKLLNWNAYNEKNVVFGATNKYTGNVTVTDSRGNTYKTAENGTVPNWSFNATTSDVMDTTVVPNGTIYAYDFYWNNNFYNAAGDVAYAWNTVKTSTAVAEALVNGAISADGGVDFTAENGTGVYNKGVRYEVVGEWVDFLDSLAINADNGYRETEAQFIKNYTDLYYGDPVYSAETGKLLSYNYVDLYNLDDLLHDIYTLNNKASYSNANTSQLVYLMQQYNKYIGNYVTPDEAETTEWGKLLLSVLEGANSSDFKKAADYKKYTNAVEDLADAYDEATTANMVDAAEQGMYDLLTNSKYTASATGDKKELSATLNGLFFNAKSVPSTYTGRDGYTAQYNQYGYDGADSVYALYPMADYAQQGNYNKDAVYTGNSVAAHDPYVETTYYTLNNEKVAAESTDEYQWFWNVYQLAYKMNKSNKYQGSIDAVNEALTAAVDALAVTTSPKSSEVAAKEEALKDYEGKIESDYDAGYYGKYTQANDYAENVAEGKYQTRLAAKIVNTAGEALTYQGTQVVVTKNDITALKASIKEGQTALAAIKEKSDYSAAQVNALNKAISKANDLVELYEGSLHAAPSWYGDRYANLLQSVNHIEYTGRVGDKDQMVKSDLTAAISAIDSAINYSNVVMGWSKNDAGKWQYGTEDGYLSNGWNKVGVGKTWFYFNADGTAKQSEWFEENGKWYYFNSNCGALCGWGKVDGNWYYFKGDNHMKTGWEKVDGNWYYLASSGKMVTGWTQIDGKWYYFSKESNSLGQMLANTTVDGYKLDANGVWNK